MEFEITVNGENREYDARPELSELVKQEAGEEAEHVAIARNGTVVERSRWDEVRVEEGDEIEIVRPIQGGDSSEDGESQGIIEPLAIGDRTLSSRLIMGTGGFTNLQQLEEALEAGRPDLVTVGLRRVNVEQDDEGGLMDVLDRSGVELLPNTAGCYTAEDAVRTAQLGREALGTNWVKLEVIGDDDTLYPEVSELLEAARRLIERDFVVLPYTSDDPITAKKLESVGCPAVMPLGSPIGSGRGLANPDALRLVVEAVDVPVIVDAGIGCASDAARALELGAEGVLSSSAIAKAERPPRMAAALRRAVEAGWLSRRAGRIPQKLYGRASTTMEGRIRT